MNVANETQVKAEIEVTVIRDGQRITLGVITSPYNDRLRNWLWKKWRERQIRRELRRIR